MKELLVQLDRWLRTHRADYYGKLNPPATDAELKELESEAGVPLSVEFKALLRWKNGQPLEVVDTFHPHTNEMFASSQSMVRTMREMNELVKYGDISAESWSRSWAPFMDNGGGDMTCLDLKTGTIVSRDHETQEIVQTYSNLERWLAELLRELSTNNFEAWDFKECRSAS